MKKPINILFTGGSGFVGRNILPGLSEKYSIFAPGRKELELRDGEALARYVSEKNINCIIHCANPNPVKNPKEDPGPSFFEDSLRVFVNIYRLRSVLDQIIYLGSGAEYDKSKDIVCIREEDVFRSFPSDVYGSTKYIMNELASKSDNIINLRLFACYGPTDHESKFITHCIDCIKRDEPITIRQDCRFDYIHVFDLGRVIDYFLSNSPMYKDYNIASGKTYLLSEIAEMVKTEMGASNSIHLLRDGFNNEYTACVDRLADETGLVDSFISLKEGIRIQLDSERGRS